METGDATGIRRAGSFDGTERAMTGGDEAMKRDDDKVAKGGTNLLEAAKQMIQRSAELRLGARVKGEIEAACELMRGVRARGITRVEEDAK